MADNNIERERIFQAHSNPNQYNWLKWGPYLSERAWGTVREDYSGDGNFWTYFTHDQSRSHVYRWNEDGIGGISDDQQTLCFALAFWNGKDTILKERIFGLTGLEGNHGEDVKDYFFYLDNTPSHSYMKYLYKYPHQAFPYTDLVQTNGRRTRYDSEYELLDTGIFNDDRYWDVFIEYAKNEPEDIIIRITVINRGPEDAEIDLLPTLWFRNTWSWGHSSEKGILKGHIDEGNPSKINIYHANLGNMQLICDGNPDLLFCENETNIKRLYGASENPTPYVKDAFHQYIIHGDQDAINYALTGTKASLRYHFLMQSHSVKTVYLRLTNKTGINNINHDELNGIIDERIKEADNFYNSIGPKDLNQDTRLIMRQVFAGLLWSKQYYHYDVNLWLTGDPAMPKPPASRLYIRNTDWKHINADNIISMPDCWEYPWFASWDLAFQCISYAIIDPSFAKEQLLLLCHDWYQHPNGQLPAYEDSFSDVNPPVHAWAALRIYRIEQRVKSQIKGSQQQGDIDFLKRIFHKLLIYFTWWVNRKDIEGKNLFQGGFLGLDNVGLFDRNKPLSNGGYLEQSDGTSWMAMFCQNMLTIALTLSSHDRSYEPMAIKFFEHFIYIAHAINNFGEYDEDLWDEEDGFYYDVLHQPNGLHKFLRVRSVVGLIPLLAVDTIEDSQYKSLPEFKSRVEWFIKERPELCKNVTDLHSIRQHSRRLLSIVSPDRLKIILNKMLDENEFLSQYGIRSVSKYHQKYPLIETVDEAIYR